MAAYRVCLLSTDGGVVEEKVIHAVRNYEAIDSAICLVKAARMNCAEYEVWLRNRRNLAPRTPQN